MADTDDIPGTLESACARLDDGDLMPFMRDFVARQRRRGELPPDVVRGARLIVRRAVRRWHLFASYVGGLDMATHIYAFDTYRVGLAYTIALGDVLSIDETDEETVNRLANTIRTAGRSRTAAHVLITDIVEALGDLGPGLVDVTPLLRRLTDLCDTHQIPLPGCLAGATYNVRHLLGHPGLWYVVSRFETGEPDPSDQPMTRIHGFRNEHVANAYANALTAATAAIDARQAAR